jgi:aldose 1-epimerase
VKLSEIPTSSVLQVNRSEIINNTFLKITNMRVKIIFIISMALLAITAISCKQKQPLKTNQIKMKITKESYGILPDSTEVNLFTMTNQHGIRMKVTNYGGIITSLEVPGRNGELADIVLGYDNLDGYLKMTPYFGAIVGRYGNRIAKGKFILDGKEYLLARNNGENHLHGGIKGFDKVVWDAQEFKDTSKVGLMLHYLSRDGEEGYPGNLDITVSYSLTNNNELRIDYLATTDKATPVNITQHSYFNLKGGGNSDILNHIMMINASRYTVVDSSLIPTGELRSVNGTPMDFTSPIAIGARIKEVGGKPVGYDHNYVLNSPGQFELAVKVYEPESGRIMEVFTDQPGVQFYTGNFLDGSITGKGGKKYDQYYGFCLETQHFPDSPNHPDFPNTILRTGESYKSTTVFRFLTE